MVNNSDRAAIAFNALCCFADATMGGEFGGDAIHDLIVELAHLARGSMGTSRDQAIKLLEDSIGTWSAEDRSVDGEPYTADIAVVSISGRPRP